MKLEINPERTVLWLLVALALLLVANYLTLIPLMFPDYFNRIMPFESFNFDKERNFPTMFGVYLFFTAALLCGAIAVSARMERRRWLHWAGMGFVLLFMSVDDATELHEKLSTPLREALGTSGPLYFAWVIPYALGVLALGCCYMPWFFRLPLRSRWLFAGAAVLFVGGALGVELIGSLHYQEYGKNLVYYALWATVEETLEFLGKILLIYALLDYMRQSGGVRVLLGGQGAEREDAAHAEAPSVAEKRDAGPGFA